MRFDNVGLSSLVVQSFASVWNTGPEGGLATFGMGNITPASTGTAFTASSAVRNIGGYNIHILAKADPNWLKETYPAVFG